MTYLVFLQSTAENAFKATTIAFPDCVAAGRTRDEALANLKGALATRLAQGEIVTVEVGESPHPWLKWFGMFEGDPTYEGFVAEIEAYRRELDAIKPLYLPPERCS